MQVVKAQNFLSETKDKHLLLDTNIFIDASIKPTEFTNLFNELKDNGTTLVTLDAIKIEFLKGASSEKAFKEKKEYLEELIDATLPIVPQVVINMYKLTEMLKQNGAGVSMADLIIGATLMHYKSNLLLVTKNTKDFPINIFTFKTLFNFVGIRTIHSYGVYAYEK